MTMIGSFLIIEDRTELIKGIGSKLFNGSSIYAFCDEITVSGKNNVSTKPKIGIDIRTEIDDTLQKHWERRKAQSQYASTEPVVIVARGRWVNQLGSSNAIGEILTPYKLMRLGISAHEFYIRGTRFLDNILEGENETCGSFYDKTKGIPVFIDGWDGGATSKNENETTWTLTFREDK